MRSLAWIGVFLAAGVGTAPVAGQSSLPMEPARTVHIDRTAGTWISLDVSPDGETVVFDYLGDLYTIPIEGGVATQLTSGMAFDAQPRFSPDGSRVAFTSDRSGGENIWTKPLDGGDAVQISSGRSNYAGSPEWTPDGEYIIASMAPGHGPRDDPRLQMFHVDGGRGAPLVQEEDLLKMMGAAFGADPRYIWFARLGTTWEYNADMPQYQLGVYDRSTGEWEERTSRFGSAFRPTLSPDGRWLVYGSRHEHETGLVIRDLETDEERWLAYPVQHDDQESKATLDVLPGMSFTPDSRHVVASYGGRIWKIPVAGGSAEPIPFRVRVDLPVGPKLDFEHRIADEPTFPVRQIRNAVPSPDGQQLAFTALDQLWVAGAEGQEPRRLAAADIGQFFPAWSPDGRWIAFTTWDDREGAGHLWKARADGRGEPRRLTREPGLYVSPVWSPDGERLVVLQGDAREFQEADTHVAARNVEDIVWVPASGGEAERIAAADGRSHPHFSLEEPQRIYLYDRSDGLVSIDWDGGAERAHVRVPGGDLILKAPRGDLALAFNDGQLYTVTVPWLGGEAPSVTLGSPASAAFPTHRLTGPIGGEFPAWSWDGQRVHWSLGNAHFVYDLEGPSEVAAAPLGEPVGGLDRPAAVTEFRVRVTAERDIPDGTFVLRGGRVITMRGDEVIDRGDVVVRNDRIVAVGPTGEVPVPDGARVVDVSGRTVMPGLVDLHVHPLPTWVVHRRNYWPFAGRLAFGVTTMRDPQSETTDMFTYADLERAGVLLSPRIFTTGRGTRSSMPINTLEDAKAILTRYRDYYGTHLLKMYDGDTRRERQLILMAAHELELMPTTEGSLDFKRNLTTTIDGYPGMEHAIPVYPIYGDVVQLFADVGRTITPTLLVAYGGPAASNYFLETEDVHDNPKVRRFTPHDELDDMARRRGFWSLLDEHVFPDLAEFAADLVEAGGRVGVGSHSRLPGLDTHWELWALQSGGLSEHDALRAATIDGADAMGLDRDLGSIEPGKLADLVVLEANPLEDIRNTSRALLVVKNGRIYDADTLAEIFPREREGPSFWWWDDDPGQLPGVSSP